MADLYKREPGATVHRVHSRASCRRTCAINWSQSCELSSDSLQPEEPQVCPQTIVKMQEKVFFFTHRTAAAVALCIVLLMLTQQVCAGPLARSNPDPRPDRTAAHVQRRIARMTPLWRIMNSKPFGAYCQNNYECSTGFCRAGRCSTRQRAPSEIVNY